MRNFRINWAVILALIVLLGFTYFSFMGFLYNNHVNGDLFKGGLYAACVILIVSACVVIMCVSKATRWKIIGTVGQVLFALIILVVFGLSAIPFTGFMRAIDSKAKIQNKIEQTKRAADSLDKSYNTYAEQRLKNYEDWLRMDLSRYENAGGDSAEKKIANLKNSLGNRLKPQSLDSCQEARKVWLSNIEGMSVWNISLPKNLKFLGESTQKWTEDYVSMSNISFDGNPPALFEYECFDDNPLRELGEINISWVAVLAALMAFFIMLLPYIVTETFIGDRTHTKGIKNRHNIVEEKDHE